MTHEYNEGTSITEIGIECPKLFGNAIIEENPSTAKKLPQESGMSTHRTLPNRTNGESFCSENDPDSLIFWTKLPLLHMYDWHS